MSGLVKNSEVGFFHESSCVELECCLSGLSPEKFCLLTLSITGIDWKVYCLFVN